MTHILGRELTLETIVNFLSFVMGYMLFAFPFTVDVSGGIGIGTGIFFLASIMMITLSAVKLFAKITGFLKESLMLLFFPPAVAIICAYLPFRFQNGVSIIFPSFLVAVIAMFYFIAKCGYVESELSRRMIERR